MRVLLTGASGFLGSHVLRHLMENTDWHVIAPVSYWHKGTSSRIDATMAGHDWSRLTILMHDLTGPFNETELARIGDVEYIVNVAAESHVDRSITDPVPFTMNNVALALNMLELARVLQPYIFIQISTDEVYGPALRDVYPNGHPEWAPIIPSNPYSASKAAQEAVAISYWRTYGVPVIITNTMNLIGEMQSPEKFVPKTMRALTMDLPATVHVSPDGEPGSRFYLHARNMADAILWILTNLEPDAYPSADRPLRLNIVGEREVRNDEMVHMIADIMGVSPVMSYENFHESRPGHDLRYALDGSALNALGWAPPLPLDKSLTRTIQWTQKHPEWL